MCQFYDRALTALMFCLIYLFASVLAGWVLTAVGCDMIAL